MQGMQKNMYEYVADQFGKDVFVPMPEGVIDEEHHVHTPEDTDLKWLIDDVKKNNPNPTAQNMEPEKLIKIMNEDRLS